MMIDIRDIDEFQSHFVKPMVDAVREEMKPLVTDVTTLKEDVSKLKGNEKKALLGWGLYASGLAAVLAYGQTKIKSYFFK